MNLGYNSIFESDYPALNWHCQENYVVSWLKNQSIAQVVAHLEAQQFFYLHLDVHPKDLCVFKFLDLQAESMYNLANDFVSVFEMG